MMKVMKFNNLKRSSRIIITFLIGVIFAMALLKIFEVLQTDEKINTKSKTPFSYNSAVSKASPAVVNIFSEQLVNKRINRPRKNIDSIFSKRRNQIKTSLGSGVLFSSDGYILTNQHVIGDTNVNVIVELSDGRKINAKIVGIDKGTDLAVLKADLGDGAYPSIEIEDSDKVRIGDVVLAIGNPYGLGQSVSMGIISATGREYENPYSNYLQTDASINKGNSGGALIDLNGRLIGINTIIRSSSGGSEGIGLAIPSSVALNVISDLIQYGEVRRGWLGFSIDQMNLLKQGQLVVSEVIPESPASKSGLSKSDLILSINKQAASYEELFKTFARSKPGDTVALEILRNKETIDIEIISGELN
jgi:serine protease DegS